MGPTRCWPTPGGGPIECGPAGLGASEVVEDPVKLAGFHSPDVKRALAPNLPKAYFITSWIDRILHGVEPTRRA